MNIEARFLVTYGKYRMFHELTTYIVNKGEINAFFILYDTDNEDKVKIDSYNDSLKILEKYAPVEIFPIEPDIENWIIAGIKHEKHYEKRELQKISLEIKFDVELAKRRNILFKDFIKKLEVYEKMNSKEDNI